MRDHFYVNSKIGDGVRELGRGAGKPKDKLFRAMCKASSATMFGEMPTDQCDRLWNLIMEATTVSNEPMPEGYEMGNFHWVISRMSDERAREVSNWLRDLYALTSEFVGIKRKVRAGAR